MLTHEKNDEVEYLSGMLMMQFIFANTNWTVLNPASQDPPECEYGWYMDPGSGECMNSSTFMLPLNATAYNVRVS